MGGGGDDRKYVRHDYGSDRAMGKERISQLLLLGKDLLAVFNGFPRSVFCSLKSAVQEQQPIKRRDSFVTE